MIFETGRLVLREMADADVLALRAIMQDVETVAAYEGPFSDAEVDNWLAKQQQNYWEFGHGLWAVTLKQPSGKDDVGLADDRLSTGNDSLVSGKMIGQCGITWQEIDGQRVLEVGYLFNREYWHKGCAIEAAAVCRDWAFMNLNASQVYAQVRDTNIASMNVAIRLGMTIRSRFIKHYRGVVMPHYAFAVENPNLILVK